ncbi:hypothetical protein SORBI_3001G121850 [Sorghum bicolor]|uniref:Uncharacterized protein n=1 Tax=Sorghum bicolor TaxID=4558 RepID=A0A1Z5S5V6_SORBI|nr:hypothetical protein SORBI_3001G121850 [Sorghum bicolor]
MLPALPDAHPHVLLGGSDDQQPRPRCVVRRGACVLYVFFGVHWMGRDIGCLCSSGTAQLASSSLSCE